MIAGFTEYLVLNSQIWKDKSEYTLIKMRSKFIRNSLNLFGTHFSQCMHNVKIYYQAITKT